MVLIIPTKKNNTEQIISLIQLCYFLTVWFSHFTFVISLLRFFERKFLTLLSNDKLETYPYCQNAYEYQTWQGGDLLLGDSIHKVA